MHLEGSLYVVVGLGTSGPVNTLTFTAKAGKGLGNEPELVDLFDCVSELSRLLGRSKLGRLRTERKIAAIILPQTNVTSGELDAFVKSASSAIGSKMKFPPERVVLSLTKEYRSFIVGMKKKEADKPVPQINPDDVTPRRPRLRIL